MPTPQWLADKASAGMDDSGGGDSARADDNLPDDAENPELEAQMAKLLKAMKSDDAAEMAKAFEGAMDACE